VIDLGVEDDLGGIHGVFISQQKFSIENTTFEIEVRYVKSFSGYTFIRSIGGSVDFNLERKRVNL